MIKIITVLTRDTPGTTWVVDDFFRILTQEDPYGAIHQTTLCAFNEYVVFFAPEDGSLDYGEIHLIWQNDDDYNRWTNATEVHALRDQYEYPFFDRVRASGINLDRYLPFDDSARDAVHAHLLADYQAPAFNLVFRDIQLAPGV